MTDFNYDLQELQTAMNSPRIKIPPEALQDDNSFNEWIKSTDSCIFDKKRMEKALSTEVIQLPTGLTRKDKIKFLSLITI